MLNKINEIERENLNRELLRCGLEESYLTYIKSVENKIYPVYLLDIDSFKDLVVDPILSHIKMCNKFNLGIDLNAITQLDILAAQYDEQKESRVKAINYIKLKTGRDISTLYLSAKAIDSRIAKILKVTNSKFTEDRWGSYMDARYKKSLAHRKDKESDAHLVKSESNISEVASNRAYKVHSAKRDIARKLYSEGKGVEFNDISKTGVNDAEFILAKELENKGYKVEFLKESKEHKTSYSCYLPEYDLYIDLMSKQEQKDIVKTFNRKYSHFLDYETKANFLVFDNNIGVLSNVLSKIDSQIEFIRKAKAIKVVPPLTGMYLSKLTYLADNIYHYMSKVKNNKFCYNFLSTDGNEVRLMIESEYLRRSKISA